MKSIQNLSVLQIAGCVAGLLVLNKILKAKVGIVAKGTALAPIIPITTPKALVAEIPAVHTDQPIITLDNTVTEIPGSNNDAPILYNPGVTLETNSYFN